jgi:hypothetical protein
MLEASWRTADAVVAQKTRQTDPKDFGSGSERPGRWFVPALKRLIRLYRVNRFRFLFWRVFCSA